MDLKKICRGCFREKPEAGGTCPYCGFDEIKYERERDPEVLPLNTVLRGTYVIGRCLGRGGFGITYLGWHVNLQTVVAIKEFFPSGIVSRDSGNPNPATRSDVTMVNTGSTKAYRKSLDGFIKEARTLGGLRLPGVVRVYDFFEENRTAYIVMDYVEGENLSLWLKHSGGRLPEERVLELIRPLTGSLQKLHEKGIIHRDISPDNLILQPDGSIMLVDFGAARTVVLEQDAEKAVQSMTVVLKPGYAPIEQYSSHGRQGPWTDVYAFCATLFRMLTGAAPADPGTRADTDNDEEILRKSLENAGVSQKTINALIKGLQVLSKNRYQSMRELDEALYGAEESGTESHADESGTQQPQTGQGTQEKKTVTTGGIGPSQLSGKKTHRRLITAVLIGALILAAAVIGFTVHSRNSKRQEATERVSEAETQEASEKITETETQKAAAVETEAAAAETESEDEMDFFIDALDGETEEDFWETESEYEYFFDETETEAEIIPRPAYNVSDYLKIDDDEYLNMTIEVAPARQVTDEEIDSHIADSFSYLEDYNDLVIKKEEGTVQDGDNVNIDYVGKKDGKAFEGGTAEGQNLVIGSGSFIDGFEEGLIGKEIGSTVDLNLTFPEEYGVEELNGADVVFTVTINYVSEMPEITDEIAEKLSDGEYKTVEDYREAIRSEIQSGYDEEHDKQIGNEVMQKLNELYPIEEYPQANVDYSVDKILSQYITPNASMYGMTTEEFVQAAYGMEYDDFMEQQLVPSAQQTVAQEIILGAIAEKEGITMTEEELQERLQNYADQCGFTVDDMTQGQDMGLIRVNELNQKVMDWLREKVTIVEVAETEAGTKEEA